MELVLKNPLKQSLVMDIAYVIGIYNDAFDIKNV